MTTPPLRSAQSLLGLELGIEGTREDARLDESLWAINWFNYKFKPSYSLYNLLASPAVMAVGARLHFKGERERQIEGPKKNERETLLVVTYPSAASFLRMATRPYFLLISVFREMGLKDFVFGFTERLDSGGAPSRLPRPKGGLYLVHHFKTADGDVKEHLPALERTAKEAGGRLHFAGSKQARLVRLDGKKNAHNVATPLFMDGLLLLEIPSEEKAREFLASSPYAAFRRHTKEDGVSLFKRTM